MNSSAILYPVALQGKSRWFDVLHVLESMVTIQSWACLLLTYTLYLKTWIQSTTLHNITWPPIYVAQKMLEHWREMASKGLWMSATLVTSKYEYLNPFHSNAFKTPLENARAFVKWWVHILLKDWYQTWFCKEKAKRNE